MENEKEDISSNNKFLKIVKIRPFSLAFNLKLRENDIILALNGEFSTLPYEELRKTLDEDKNDKFISILRDQVVFNIKVNRSLGVTCEEVEENEIQNFKREEHQTFYEKDSDLIQFEHLSIKMRNKKIKIQMPLKLMESAYQHVY